jgi:solute carrier family 35 (UDP-galactose transporter), member B1
MLQEKIATTPYGADRIIFRSTLVLNTTQSLIAALLASVYIRLAPQPQPHLPSAFSNGLLRQYFLLAIASSAGSWFGYCSLLWVDYPTMVLGKSSKLLPVMFLHLVLYRRRFPGYKYLVVGMVTVGVGLFTLFHSSQVNTKKFATNSAWGLLLLSINLLADGFVNSTQDQIFAANKGLTGPQMMLGFNLCSTILTTIYLLTTYLLPSTPSEITTLIKFVQLHPRILVDILAFAISGAIGQIFIFLTLSMHGSLVLVTITVTRKLFTMLLSVVCFNHPLTSGQWAGVGLVFGGIGLEAYWTRKAKLLTKKQIKTSEKREKVQ